MYEVGLSSVVARAGWGAGMQYVMIDRKVDIPYNV
jgi:hypothetical protein